MHYLFMKIESAINLIEQGIASNISVPQAWADLGAGSGLFSRALATILPEGSTIYMVDKVSQKSNNIDLSKTISFQFLQLDFVTDNLPFNELDGLLMANALHFVEDKVLLLQKLKSRVHSQGRLIIVEYDTNISNPWVPYPVKLNELKQLGKEAGFHHLKYIGGTSSIYRKEGIYSALLT